MLWYKSDKMIYVQEISGMLLFYAMYIYYDQINAVFCFYKTAGKYFGLVCKEEMATSTLLKGKIVQYIKMFLALHTNLWKPFWEEYSMELRFGIFEIH